LGDRKGIFPVKSIATTIPQNLLSGTKNGPVKQKPGVWLGERHHGIRGHVVCEVPSSAAHVSYVCFSPDNQLVAVSADKLVYIVDVMVC